MHKSTSDQKKLEYRAKVDDAMEFWNIKCSLLLEGLVTYGPINTLTMYRSCEKTLLLKRFYYSVKMLHRILEQILNDIQSSVLRIPMDIVKVILEFESVKNSKILESKHWITAIFTKIIRS